MKLDAWRRHDDRSKLAQDRLDHPGDRRTDHGRRNGARLGSLRHILYAERADGEVIEIRREGDMYAPVLRFHRGSGETQEVKDLGSGAPDFAVGDRVTVLYMPDDPEDFRVDTFERLWFSPIFVTVFASFWFLFGAVAWALSREVELFVIGRELPARS
jgi:hypothetical protein